MPELVNQLSIDEAQAIIVSLSDGVVPKEGAHLFTAGREKWLQSLSRDLTSLASATNRSGRLRIVNGKNGDGKTHLMHLIRNMALDAGFAVSYVVISKDIPLYKSDRVYSAIGRSLITSHHREQGGLRAILHPEAPDPAIAANYHERTESIRKLPGLDPRFATVLYKFCTQQLANVDQDQDMLLLGAWLEGTNQQVAGLGVNTKIDQTIGNALLKSLVIALRHFGLPGLVILIDEVESILSLTQKQRDDSYQTLRLLVDREAMPSNTLIAASTTPPMFTDSDKGLQSYPALWSRLKPSGLSDYIDYKGTLIDLTRTPLQKVDFVTIGKRIRDIHQRACEWDPAERVTDSFIEEAARIAAAGRLTFFFSPTRVFVKLITLVLDVAEQNDTFAPSTDNLEDLFGQANDSLQETATAS